ncbi:hypothetical protein [Pseudomonas sp. SO81]|uniref:hypothetical protein n=1 Tax=Pseudomonas sp. SO81 TaxID=2983246 RepID=UPI0025A364FD|nr:hypothetical protein [Pseudomonas sp. SO81]WJN60936.1 hypothetical protein OH686_19500 [Pseudomonas sp. SO81]
MSDIGKVVNRRIGELDVVCRELTVGRLRALVTAASEMDVVHDFLFEDLRLCDLPTFTNLTLAQVDALPPSAVRVVIDGCREANADFFEMLARVKSLRAAS